MGTSEAWTALAAILGGTGLSGALIAYFGYRSKKLEVASRTPAQKVAPEAVPAVVAAYGHTIPSKSDLELVVQAVTGLHQFLMEMDRTVKAMHAALLGEVKAREEAAEQRAVDAAIARGVAERLAEREREVERSGSPRPRREPR